MANFFSQKISYFKLFYGPRLFMLSAAFLACVFIGVLISSNVTTFVVASIVAVMFFVFINLTVLINKPVQCLLITLALLQFFIFPLIYNSTGAPIYVFLQIYIIVIGLFFIRNLYSVVNNDRCLLFSFYMLLLYLLILLISTIMPATYTKSYTAMLYQLMALIKTYLVLAFAFGMSKTYGVKLQDTIYMVGKWLWIPMLIFVLIQFTAPSAFKFIFPFSMVASEETGLFPSRALGLFESSAYLASFSAFYSILFFSKAVCEISIRKKLYEFFLMGIYLFLVLSAIQRQELAALFIALVFVFVLYKKERILFRAGASLAIVLLGGVVFLVLFGDMSTKEFESWGGNRYAAISHPRANLYDGAFQIAKDSFPLGSGIGSYAGAGATKFNLELFYKMGFAKLWWFGDKKTDFLMDSYWANPIAEAGFLGACFLLLHYLLLLTALIWNLMISINGARILWLIAAASLLYILLTSSTSPSFIEPRIIFFPFLAIAMAYGVTNKEDNHES